MPGAVDHEAHAGGVHRTFHHVDEPANSARHPAADGEADHLLRRYQHPDLHKAINEAFRIAERQLLNIKEQREGHTKGAHHDGPNQALGQIAETDPGGDFGFLLTKDGALLYFHRNAMLSGNFDDLRRGHEVYYVEGMGDTGPVASKVRVKRTAANGDVSSANAPPE